MLGNSTMLDLLVFPSISNNPGTQNIHDKTHNVNISTQFLKLDGDGHDWSVRISGESFTKGEDAVINMMYYFGVESGTLNLLNKPSATGYSGDVSFSGSLADLGGDFEILVRDTGDRNLDSLVTKSHDELNSLDDTHVLGAQVPKGELWKIRGILSLVNLLKDLVYKTVIGSAHKIHERLNPTPSVAHILSLPNQLAFNPNTFVISKILRTPFQVYTCLLILV